ncbi:MAG: alpha/beta hydrolase [Candidatus Micrarchaeota archaeon]
MPVINETSALVALSLGCPTVLQLLASEKRIEQVGLLVLVSPGTRPVVIQKGYGFLGHFFDGLDRTFARVAEKVRRIEVLTSDNDPFSSHVDIFAMAKRLGASFHSIHDGGHLDTDSGFYKFPLVLDMIAPVVTE